MLEGLYSAAAGMAAQQQRLDALSNDLANASTTGYRHLRVGFRDLVYQQQTASADPGVLAGAGAAAGVLGRSGAEGALRETGRPLDLALVGPGWFQVRRADGSTALTRDGGFSVDARGRLVTSDGSRVLGPVQLPAGTDPAHVGVAADGTVTLAGGRRLGRLAIVDVPAPDGLRSVGDNLFATSPASGAARAARGTTVRQGALEASDVDVADAMVDLIDAQRSYALTSRVIQMQDQMLEIANGVKR